MIGQLGKLDGQYLCAGTRGEGVLEHAVAARGGHSAVTVDTGALLDPRAAACSAARVRSPCKSSNNRISFNYKNNSERAKVVQSDPKTMETT